MCGIHFEIAEYFFEQKAENIDSDNLSFYLGKFLFSYAICVRAIRIINNIPIFLFVTSRFNNAKIKIPVEYKVLIIFMNNKESFNKLIISKLINTIL